MALASANNLPGRQGLKISIPDVDRLSTPRLSGPVQQGLSAAYELRAAFALRFAANKRRSLKAAPPFAARFETKPNFRQVLCFHHD